MVAFEYWLGHFVGKIKGEKVYQIASRSTYAKTIPVGYEYYENQYGLKYCLIWLNQLLLDLVFII